MASYVNNGKIEIMTNEDGHRTTPSYVSFTDSEVLVGDTARAQLYRNPRNTVYDIKKIIGRTYEEIKDQLSQWKFEVKNSNGKPVISITVKGKERLYTATEIAGIMLERMRQIAEMTTSANVRKVVITIPSTFNKAQTKALVEAVRLAGMEPMKILSEPIASVISYGFDGISGEKKILDFHFGGGSYDLVLVRSVNGILEIIGQYSNPHLRGKSFHDRILDLCVAEFKKQTGIDISNNTKAIKKLELICEAAKVVLSVATSVPIEADSLAEGIDFSMKLYRPKYEAICSDLFAETMPPIEKLLAQFGLGKSEIDEIIIEGGLGKTPKISEILKDYFGKEPRNQMDPDEIIVYGSALQIMYLENFACPSDSMVVHTVCCPLSLENPVGRTRVIVPVGSPIPLRKVLKLKVKKPSYLEKDKGSKNYAIPLFIYQGENKLASRCSLIANLSLDYERDILNQLEGLLQIDLIIEILEDGTMKFTSIDRVYHKKNAVSIVHFSDQLCASIEPPGEVSAELMETFDKLKELKNYCYSVFIILRKLSISEDIKKKFYLNHIQEALSWICSKVYDPRIEPSILLEIQERRKKLENEIKELITTVISNPSDKN
eukprot:TRINITY_DN14574_c0_g1_i7.p1 TRINITY_DN14574_c0_g1~~TRINITY_DN14574_c0_g1_i7.p1  ORF type:complete len:604 (-),score=175.84 TRINITY_DN14574_c0_g1_i7:133-1944(-)